MEVPDFALRYMECQEISRRMKASFKEQHSHLCKELAELEPRVRTWLSECGGRIQVPVETDEDRARLGAPGLLSVKRARKARNMNEEILRALMTVSMSKELTPLGLDPETIARICQTCSLYCWSNRPGVEEVKIQRGYSTVKKRARIVLPDMPNDSTIAKKARIVLPDMPNV